MAPLRVDLLRVRYAKRNQRVLVDQHLRPTVAVELHLTIRFKYSLLEPHAHAAVADTEQRRRVEAVFPFMRTWLGARLRGLAWMSALATN
jgi:hypothetical protein